LEQVGFPANRLGRKNLISLLEEKYPELNWDKAYRIAGRYALQRQLEKAVASIFPVSLAHTLI